MRAETQRPLSYSRLQYDTAELGAHRSFERLELLARRSRLLDSLCQFRKAVEQPDQEDRPVLALENQLRNLARSVHSLEEGLAYEENVHREVAKEFQLQYDRYGKLLEKVEAGRAQLNNRRMAGSIEFDRMSQLSSRREQHILRIQSYQSEVASMHEYIHFLEGKGGAQTVEIDRLTEQLEVLRAQNDGLRERLNAELTIDKAYAQTDKRVEELGLEFAELLQSERQARFEQQTAKKREESLQAKIKSERLAELQVRKKIAELQLKQENTQISSRRAVQEDKRLGEALKRARQRLVAAAGQTQRQVQENERLRQLLEVDYRAGFQAQSLFKAREVSRADGERPLEPRTHRNRLV